MLLPLPWSASPGRGARREEGGARKRERNLRLSWVPATADLPSRRRSVAHELPVPAAGTPVPGKGVITCKFPADPTVALGYISFAFLVVSTVAGYMSLFYPYKGKSVPQGVLFKSTSFLFFFNIAVFTTGLAAAMLLWPTITEQMHLQRNVHNDLTYTCPTAKTGLLGGGAFLSLDSSLFWLIALMLAGNAREDFLDEEDKGDELSSSATHTMVSHGAC